MRLLFQSIKKHHIYPPAPRSVSATNEARRLFELANCLKLGRGRQSLIRKHKSSHATRRGIAGPADRKRSSHEAKSTALEKSVAAQDEDGPQHGIWLCKRRASHNLWQLSKVEVAGDNKGVTGTPANTQSQNTH